MTEDRVNDSDDLYASIAGWVADWGREVAAVDLVAARERFAADLLAFGTHADVVATRAAVEAEQWAQIWPAIEDFEFDVAQLRVISSEDRLQAVAIVPWTSTGIDADGGRFDRPGRATIVLRRNHGDGVWIGVHTHFSLARGVPSVTHGRRQAIR
jgi:ketosteroid isomerase-like protein